MKKYEKTIDDLIFMNYFDTYDDKQRQNLASFGWGNHFSCMTFAEKIMATNFKIKSLKDTEFCHLFDLDDTALANMGAVRMTVDAFPGFPCRVSLEDAEIGEEVILLPYQHHTTNAPYQAIGPIFVRKIANMANLGTNEIPKMLNHRLLSLRGYDKSGMMKYATVTEGQNLATQLRLGFERSEIHYIHIHNAKPGCYNCVAERE